MFSALAVSDRAYIDGKDPNESFNSNQEFTVLPNVRAFDEIKSAARNAGALPVFGRRVMKPYSTQPEPSIVTVTINLDSSQWRYNSAFAGLWTGTNRERVFKLALSDVPFADISSELYDGDYILFRGVPSGHSMQLSTADAATVKLEIVLTEELSPIIRNRVAEANSALFSPLDINWFSGATPVNWTSNGTPVLWSTGIALSGTPSIDSDGRYRFTVQNVPSTVAGRTVIARTGDYIRVFTGDDPSVGITTRVNQNAIFYGGSNAVIFVDDYIPKAGNVFIGFNRSY
jgi:hypothetical protein